MLHQLPVEVALHAISYLPLHSLYSATLVSRDWNALIVVNEPTVYRNAAILHRFADTDQLCAGSIQNDWKAYSRRELEIEKGWRGKAPSVARELTATGIVVHRIKVDYELGFVITTSQIGGLSVCDIKDNRVLWALPSSHAVGFAHCEYDRGYIVFNRRDNCKEVWRRAVDADDGPRAETSPPDKKMLEASVQAAASFYSAENEDRRGHFIPWALLRMPEDTRAFRFSYPTLLAAATNNAYLWDVPRSQLVSVVRNIQRIYEHSHLATINYVEVNDLYVFICDGAELRIFAREDGALLYFFTAGGLSYEVWHVTPHFRDTVSSAADPQMLSHDTHYYPSHGEFLACHVSASGNDLAILTSNGRLVIFPDFRRLFNKSDAARHREKPIILNFGTRRNEEISYYLAVGGRNGKFAVATAKGIYIVSLDLDFNRLTADRPPEPGVSVCRLTVFDRFYWLSSISCLQITHDAIYFTYKPAHALGPRSIIERAQLHDIDVQGPADIAALPVVDDDMEDVFADGGEDDDFEDEFPIGVGAAEDDPMDAIVNNWFMHTTAATVYSVSF